MSWALETIRALEPYVKKGMSEKEFDRITSFSSDTEGRAELKRLYFSLLAKLGKGCTQ